MKRSIPILILALMIATAAYADRIFDEMRSVVKGGAKGEELAAIGYKFKGRLIGGEGYVVRIENFDQAKALSDVNIEIPSGSPYARVAMNLREGQKVSFSGRFDGLFARTIYIKGSAAISPIN